MDMKSTILDLLRKHTSLGGGELTKKLKISRQALNRHLKTLISKKMIYKIGSTKKALYFLSSLPPIKEKEYTLRHLSEDTVYSEFFTHEDQKGCNKNCLSILSYTFTEMLNNTIDHSKAQKCTITLYKSKSRIAFRIQDRGVGIFNNIRKKLHLKNNIESIEELLKGKCTTEPQNHTGEGIFFTSKAVDYVIFEGSNLSLKINNEEKDYTIEKSFCDQGTNVYIEIKLQTNNNLSKIFEKYSIEYEFVKTKIIVKLYDRGKLFVSRSEAKRILKGLEKFKVVTLDFHQVKNIGQGFSDEIFRVFQKKHTTIKLQPINMNTQVEFMVKRSLKTL